MYLYDLGPRPLDAQAYPGDTVVFKSQLEQSYDLPDSCDFKIKNYHVWVESDDEEEFKEFVELLVHSLPRNWTVQSLTDLGVYKSNQDMETIFTYEVHSHRTSQPVFVEVGDTVFPVTGVIIDPTKPITIKIDTAPPV